MLSGGAGVDDLHGGLDNDTIDGGTGADTYHGDGGADTFVFAADGAADKIDDFEDGVDHIDLSAYGLADFAAVLALATEHVDGNGPHVLLTLGAGDVINISGMALAQLTADDILL